MSRDLIFLATALVHGAGREYVVVFSIAVSGKIRRRPSAHRLYPRAVSIAMTIAHIQPVTWLTGSDAVH